MLLDILPKYQVTSDGIKNTFQTPFELIKEEFINVYVGSEKQTDGYSINVLTNTVTFEEAPEAGDFITIIRAIPISWEVSAFGSLNEESLNNALTLITAKMQTLEEEISRSPKTNPYDEETGSDLSELFFTEMRDALDSLERAKVLYAQIQASGTQALSDITTEKTTTISNINNVASDRTGEFNQNATAKTIAFDNNASDATDTFNANATAKTTAFDNNASDATDTFNANATAKTTAFDNNATTKQAAVDASASAAATSATNASNSENNAASSAANALETETRINNTLSSYVTYINWPTGVI